MKFSATWMIALRALRRNLMRTGLTMLGIIIGTLSSIFVACPLLTMAFLKVTKQDLMPKAKDVEALARRP